MRMRNPVPKVKLFKKNYFYNGILFCKEWFYSNFVFVSCRCHIFLTSHFVTTTKLTESHYTKEVHANANAISSLCFISLLSIETILLADVNDA